VLVRSEYGTDEYVATEWHVDGAGNLRIFHDERQIAEFRAGAWDSIERKTARP